MLGTEFTLYDSGLNPKKAEKGKHAGKDVRRELGLVKYDRNVFGWSGPRQMNVILPALNEHQVGEAYALLCVNCVDECHAHIRITRHWWSVGERQGCGRLISSFHFGWRIV